MIALFREGPLGFKRMVQGGGVVPLFVVQDGKCEERQRVFVLRCRGVAVLQRALERTDGIGMVVHHALRFPHASSSGADQHTVLQFFTDRQGCVHVVHATVVASRFHEVGPDGPMDDAAVPQVAGRHGVAQRNAVPMVGAVQQLQRIVGFRHAVVRL